ncbi:hypothetical protein ACLB2K_065970 [Fragaria x ananassa]
MASLASKDASLLAFPKKLKDVEQSNNGLSCARRISYTTFAPPEFGAGQAPLPRSLPPAPQEEQMRASQLYNFANIDIGLPKTVMEPPLLLESEKELNAVVKCVRSDRGGEYYGRYNKTGRHKGPFASFLEENGIIAQYTTPGTPEQNGVAERRNRTFMNMVRSMMCTSGLPHFLWGVALKTANYLTNRTPSKSVSATKTPFELWKNRKPNIYHTHVWGCKAEARPYNPNESKLDPKIVSASFIGYCEHSKGYKFCCPTHSHIIIETNKAVFLNETNSSHSFEDFIFEELTEDVSTTVTSSQPQLVILETTPVFFNGIDAHAPILDPPAHGIDTPTTIPNHPPPPVIRRSQRERRSRLEASRL